MADVFLFQERQVKSLESTALTQTKEQTEREAMMFEQQKAVLESIPAVRSLHERYEQPVSWLDEQEDSVKNFVVRVPFIGAFSAGKSSLLNAFVGTRVFATNITAETGHPAELHFGQAERITGLHGSRPPVTISAEALRENQLGALPEGAWIEVISSAQNLAALPHLCLVDMPGWDSGLEGHKRAIDGYVQRSLAYVVVVSAEEGDLRESLRKAILEITPHQKPLILVISKSDKKPAEEVNAVAIKVARTISDITKTPPLRVIKASARGDISELNDALAVLESLAGSIFSSQIAQAYITNLSPLRKHIEARLGASDQTTEEIEARIDSIATDASDFEESLRKETVAIEAKILGISERIAQRVKADLESQLESFAAAAVRGNPIGPDMEVSIRLSITRGMDEEFLPEVQKYLSRVAEVQPVSISSTYLASGDGKLADYSTELAAGTGLAMKALKPMLSKLLTAIPAVGPILAVIAPIFAPILVKILFSRNEEQEAAKRRQEAREAILYSVIPEALSQTRVAIERVLKENIDEVQKKIFEQAEAQRKSLMSALNQAKADLAQSQAEHQRLQSQYVADLAALDAAVSQIQALAQN